MTITEPATLITDYILAIVAVVLAVLVSRRRRPRRLSTYLWIAGFLLTGGAAATGGTWHGFALYFSEPTHRLIWNVTVALILASSMAVLWAVFSGPKGRRHPNTPWLVSGGLVTAAGFAIQQSGVAVHPDFNHNDVFHCTQAIALCLFFKGTHSVK